MLEKTTRYFDRGWKTLTQEKGWWKPVLILGLVNCIPIIGQLIVLGYMLDWAKEASWGLERPLTHKVGDLGKRLKYGWFGFVVMIVWMLPCMLVAGIFHNVGGIGQILYAIFEIGAAVCGIIGSAAAVRAVIYERIMPGLEVKRMWNMAKMDPAGLARAWAIVLWGVLFAFVVGLVVAIPCAPFALAAMMVASGGGSVPAAAVLVSMGLGVILLVIVASVVATIGTTLFELLSMRAFGYWVGQFKPQLWGKASDPMPFERATQGAGYAATAPAAAATAEPAGEPAAQAQVEDDVIDVTPEPAEAKAAAAATAAEEQTPAVTSDDAAEEVAAEEPAEEPAEEAPAEQTPAVTSDDTPAEPEAPAKAFEQKRMGGNADWHTKWQ